jgi:hypothetical protein
VDEALRMNAFVAMDNWLYDGNHLLCDVDELRIQLLCFNEIGQDLLQVEEVILLSGGLPSSYI